MQRVRPAVRSMLTAGVLGLAPAFVAAGASTATAADGAVGCDLPVGDQDFGDADGALVVMLDGTISSQDQSDRVDGLAHYLDAATTDHKLVVSIGSFGGSDAEVRFSSCLDGVLFIPDGNNARTRARNRPGLLDAADQELAALPAGYQTSDPTSALRAGVRRLAAATTGQARDDSLSKTLVIHTDGIPTTGCAALPAEVDASDPGLVDSLTQACVVAGQLPDATGIDIVVAGVGRTNQDLSAAAVTFLLNLSTSLCEATGAASCTVDANLPSDI